MSTISEIFKSYRNALTDSRQTYDELYTQRSSNAAKFYRNFFHQLIVPQADFLSNKSQRRMLTRKIAQFAEQDTLDFVAIDGTCIKKPFSDFITFYGGAYGAKGQLQLTEDPPKIRYKKWSLNKDVSMVAWVPIPFAQLADVTDPRFKEDFILSEQEKVNLASIHTLVMQLAEVFLAYNTAASSELEYPRVLMMDMSPSSVLASVAMPTAKVGLVGYPYDRRQLDEADVIVAMAHPFNNRLGIPSAKAFLRYRAILAAFANHDGCTMSERDLARELNVPEHDLRSELDYLERRGVIERKSITTSGVKPKIDISASWDFTVSLFRNICTRLFLKKDSSALQYKAEDEEGVVRRRWMSPDDLKFLIGVGLRALIEKCWEKKILLYGVIKDSESRYLTRNYLGVALEMRLYPELADLAIPLLPWTDRIFMETLPLADEALEAPWGTIEFDSAYMTLHRERLEDGRTQVAGVMGRIVNHERLFLRCLAQFFLKRDRATPMMGHVIFLDRLAFPEWDGGHDKDLLIDTPTLGQVRPITYRDRNQTNVGQQIMMYLLSVLTRNHFPEVIGYPDPLHKADWGAKTVGRRVARAIESSVLSFKANPITRTFRSIRDSFRR